MAEVFDIVDEDDSVIGKATRKEVHGNPDLIHRVAHVLVFDSGGRLFLQKRAADKLIQPGKWDTSVGGHVDSGEDYLTAARRETAEELGIDVDAACFEFMYKYLHSNEIESEMVSTFRLVWNGPITVQESEIEEGRFWNLEEIRESTGKAGFAGFTPNFLDELERYSSLER